MITWGIQHSQGLNYDHLGKLIQTVWKSRDETVFCLVEHTRVGMQVHCSWIETIQSPKCRPTDECPDELAGNASNDEISTDELDMFTTTTVAWIELED